MVINVYHAGAFQEASRRPESKGYSRRLYGRQTVTLNSVGGASMPRWLVVEGHRDDRAKEEADRGQRAEQ